MNSVNNAKGLITGSAAALLMFSGAAVANDPAIELPTVDEVVYTNTIELLGHDAAAAGNQVQWAVRLGTCARGTGTVAGNVDGFDDPFIWKDGAFETAVDATDWVAGRYCFVLNTMAGAADGSRLTQGFYLVDEFAKVGGTIGMGEQGSGGSPTHAFDGVVGNAGINGVVGSININYRKLKETLNFEAADLSLRDASGIGVEDGTAVADITTASGATILVLDRDASPDFPRGAIIVRFNGGPSVNSYEIDNTPGQTGADSWVEMERGNNKVGVR